MDSTRLAERIAEVAREKLGEDTVIIDLRGISALADYFVVTTAASTVHARAVAEAISLRLKEQGERADHIEGAEHGQWVLLDYVDVVVHILLGEVRRFYGFERLWGDAPQRVLADRPDEENPASRETSGDAN